MHKIWLTGAVAAILICEVTCKKPSSSRAKYPSIETKEDSLSYVIGTDIGQSLMKFKSEIDIGQLRQGVRDQLFTVSVKIPQEQANSIMQKFGSRIQKKQGAELKEKSERNLAEGKKFLQENKTNPDVLVTTSGLQYIILKQGNGRKPKETEMVKVHYKGTLLDGSEFFNSYSKGTPLETPVKGVIKGWSEALQLMTPGSRFKVFIPPELGYGLQSVNQQIGPNTLLVFEIELLEILN